IGYALGSRLQEALAEDDELVVASKHVFQKSRVVADELNRSVDLMGNARGKLPDRFQLLGLHQLAVLGNRPALGKSCGALPHLDILKRLAENEKPVLAAQFLDDVFPAIIAIGRADHD